MVSLSPRFTALAVLCSVAALTLPYADAAPMSLRPPARSVYDDAGYVAPPAYGTDSMPNKRFGGGSDSMFATEAIWNARFARRPLSGLSGFSFDDQKSGNLPRQGYHQKVSRSVYIEGQEGKSYIVKSEKRMGGGGQQHFTTAEWKRQGHPAEWRRQDGTGVPGTIDIMSPTADPSHPLQRIASLVLGQDNSANATNGTFVLNASPDDKTQMFLVPMANSTMISNSTQDIAVMLQVPVFDAATAATQTWCATFDPAPPTPISMTAQECLDPETNGMDGDHTSQIFSFNTVTGAVRPLWNSTQSDSTSDSDIVPTAQQAAYVDPQTPDDASIASVTDFEAPIRRQEAQAPFASSSSSSAASSTMSPASTSSVTSADFPTSTPSSDASSGSLGGSAASDVTLMFVPSVPQINAVVAQDVSSSSASSSTEAETSTTAASSTTAYPTMGSSSTETPASSTTKLSSAAAFAQVAEASSSASSQSAPGSASVSASSTSASTTSAPLPPLPVFRPLNVEVVPEAIDADATPTLALPHPTTTVASSSASSSANATANATGSSSSAAATASSSIVARAEEYEATPPYTWMFKRDD